MADGNHDNQSIVIVNGSSMTQTGWAGDDAPVTVCYLKINMFY